MPQVSFDKDIKPLMTEADRNHMEFMFDLWSYKDVKDNADDIYDSVSNGRMPPPQEGDRGQRTRLIFSSNGWTAATSRDRFAVQSSKFRVQGSGLPSSAFRVQG